MDHHVYHPEFWALQDALADLPVDKSDYTSTEESPELQSILQYLFVDRPVRAPPGYQVVADHEVADVKHAREVRVWSRSWAKTLLAGSVGTIGAAALFSIPRIQWVEGVLQKRWPEFRTDVLGKVLTYTALFVTLCLLQAAVDHPTLVRSLVTTTRIHPRGSSEAV
jgi:hypothetical protein